MNLNLNFAKQNKVGNYGAVSFQNGGLNSVTGMVFDGNSNHVTTNLDGDCTDSTLGVKSLDVLNVRYVVREWVGSWWKGACFRKVRQKVVLDDISIRLKSGEITAILGNSGKYTCYLYRSTTEDDFICRYFKI